ncbi:hypothetical protein [Fluviispira multicolorata]|uniref:Lipoprotein n=1 Tax=Fluviispira multicolorata TaxID=2654512 RepID=A0A833JBV8_9BACT|nr:hypothetical protein [Fluviispira multicolorata]KAB8029856.1 hypothetical protein GCL57_09975 [Fluviispira multicolorata]
MKKNHILKYKVLITLSFVLSITSCTSISDIAEKTTLSIDKNVSIGKTKVLVLPIMSQTNSTFNSTLLDAHFITLWENNIGKENIIPIPYLVLKENKNATEALEILSNSMKTKKPSKIKGTVAEVFLNDISTKYGHYPISLTSISADKDFYDSNGNFTTYIGLFDIKTFTWKWVTERSYKNNLFIVKFEDAVQQSIKTSFNDFKKENYDSLF